MWAEGTVKYSKKILYAESDSLFPDDILMLHNSIYHSFRSLWVTCMAMCRMHYKNTDGQYLKEKQRFVCLQGTAVLS